MLSLNNKGINQFEILWSINQGASMMAMKASIANTLLGLKKAGSTSCLAPPTSGIGLASRSLPPSPCASRKVEVNKTNFCSFSHYQVPSHSIAQMTDSTVEEGKSTKDAADSCVLKIDRCCEIKTALP